MATANPSAINDWYSKYKGGKQPSGILPTQAMAGPQSDTELGNAPNAIDPTKFDVTNRVQGYDPNTTPGANWNVGNDQTVQGQLKGIIDQDSPLQQQAKTRSMQDMNAHGLLSSSMAVGAGQSAVIASALPIAQQDAQTFGNASRFNAEATNRAAEFTAGAKNTGLIESARMGLNAEQSNQRGSLDRQMQQAGFAQQTAVQTTDIAAQAQRQVADIQAQAAQQGRQLTAQEQAQIRDIQNQKGMQQAGFAQQTGLQDRDFAQQSKTQAADLASRYNLANMDVQSRAALQQADAANQQTLQKANAALQTGLQSTDLNVKQSMQGYDAAIKQSMQGVDNASKLSIATLDANNRIALVDIEAKFKKELQGSQSMASSYQSMVDNFTRVMLNNDLDKDAKPKVIADLFKMYDNTMQMQSDISGLKIGDMFSGFAKDQTTPTEQLPQKTIPKGEDDWMDYGYNASGQPVRVRRR